MATCHERPNSRTRKLGDSPTATLRYVAFGAEDGSEALSAALAVSPYLYHGLVRKTPTIDPQGGGVFYIDLEYAERKPREAGDWKYNFDTGGGTQKIYTSLETVDSGAAPGEELEDHDGAIGVTDDGVEGCDIVVPVFNFGYTFYFDPQFISPAYGATIYQLTGKVNNAPWKGYDAGEVLLQGATLSAEGNVEGTKPVEVSYKFAASPNLQVSVGRSGITLSKGGWDYLWSKHGRKVGASGKTIEAYIKSAYVERVYQTADFSRLGIG